MGKKTEILLRVRLLEQQLQGIRTVVNRLETLIMALADDLKAGIKKLDDETTVIAALITSLAGRITNSMSDQEVADVKAALQGEADRLTSLAVDPTVPVPVPPPQLLATRAKAKP